MLIRLIRGSRSLSSAVIALPLLLLVAMAASADSGSVTYNGCENLATGIVRLLNNTSLPSPWNQCLTAQNSAAVALLAANPRLLETPVTWNQIGPQGPTGAAGPQGAQGLAGPSGPTGPSGPQGQQGPQGPAGSAGPAGANGADGRTVLNGSGAPLTSLGNDGDFYIDTTNHVVYGPKAGGVWPSTGTGLVGPLGPVGATGANGPAGPAGPPGPPGPSGGTPVPDTYGGLFFQISIDGSVSGLLQSLDGCTAHLVSIQQPVNGLTRTGVQQQGYDACELTFGFGAGAPFFGWVNSAIAAAQNGAPPPMHAVELSQYVLNSGSIIGVGSLGVSQAVLTKFSLPAIDGGQTTVAYFSAEIQSQNQTLQLVSFARPNPSGFIGGVQVQSSTLQDSIATISGTPINVITTPYSWSLDTTRSSGINNAAPTYTLNFGSAHTTDLAALVADTTTLGDLRAWAAQFRGPTPEAATLSVWMDTNQTHVLRVAFTGMIPVEPIDPFSRSQSGMYKWGAHADSLSITMN